ncbi:hypothetical protein BKA81DRAFT_226312 [Phyllosticta paracitricarpa]|uniref:Cysteine-rich transmembrane CYSTM domain-containing protein n=1 Tax=Phyllosticta paracitricarpa TaxID=2016321 RepID=A0ABR1MTY0_9PEZI
MFPCIPNLDCANLAPLSPTGHAVRPKVDAPEQALARQHQCLCDPNFWPGYTSPQGYCFCSPWKTPMIYITAVTPRPCRALFLVAEARKSLPPVLYPPYTYPRPPRPSPRPEDIPSNPTTLPPRGQAHLLCCHCCCCCCCCYCCKSGTCKSARIRPRLHDLLTGPRLSPPPRHTDKRRDGFGTDSGP